MRRARPIAVALVVLLGAVVTALALPGTAGAHGYISSPPSRQALCASGAVQGCGDIIYEPQSVEAPKGSTLCNGGGSRFAVLNDESRNWPATSVGPTVTFHWTLTAMHSTGTWEYSVAGDRVASFDDGGAIPGSTVSHTVDLSGHPGRITLLAVWNIADTPNAFYNCVDLDVGGSGASGGYAAPPPAPAPTTTTTAPPPPAGPAEGSMDDMADMPADTPSASPSSPAQGGTGTVPPPDGGTGSYGSGHYGHYGGYGGYGGYGSGAYGSASYVSATTGADRGTWTAWTPYATGDTVTWEGRRYTCRQGHTSQPDWAPSIWTLALWLPI